MRDINEILKYSKPLTLLYVEDNRELRLRNEEIFRDYFREVVCVSTAIEALQYYKNRNEQTGYYFDIVITDIEMPRINGIELCRRLLAENTNQKLIALSAHNEPHYLFELINIGVSSFLLKPITAQALSEAIYTAAKSIYDERMIRFRTHQVEILNQRLKTNLSELNASLIREQEIAKQKNRFLSNITHEMLTPIETISILGKQLVETKLTERQKDSIDKICHSADQALETVRSILDVSDIESGNIILESIDFNLNDILLYLSEKIGEKAREKNLDIAFELPKHLPIRFIGDPYRLRQILYNLLANAIQFTDHGNVRLKIDIQNNEETTRIVRFDVIDSGIGMSSTQCAHIFEPFTASTPQAKRRHSGAGLGLQISNALTQKMGGEISVRSSLGKGSTFSIQIPLPLSNPQERRLYRLPDASMMGKNVLIIDPHHYSANALAQKLHYFHCDVDIHTGCTNIPFGSYYDLMIVDASLFDDFISISPSSLEETKLVVLGTKKPLDNSRLYICDYLPKPFTQQMLFELLIKIYSANDQNTLPGNRLGTKQSLLPFKGCRILLAEENSQSYSNISYLLNNTGIEIISASNGLELLRNLEQKEFDLVLMDIVMPIMGGIQAAHTIRAQPKFDGIPLIGMMSEPSSNNADAAKKAGMEEVLNKPLEENQLYELLVRFLKPKQSILPKAQ